MELMPALLRQHTRQRLPTLREAEGAGSRVPRAARVTRLRPRPEVVQMPPMQLPLRRVMRLGALLVHSGRGPCTHLLGELHTSAASPSLAAVHSRHIMNHYTSTIFLRKSRP